MKKQFFIYAFTIGAFVFTANVSSAQVSDVSEPAKVEANQLPPTINSTFSSKYQGVKNVDWSMENETYKAKFNKDGKDMYAEFTPEGEWLETATMVEKDKLPAAIPTYLQQNYADYTVGKSKLIETEEENTYEVKVVKDSEETSLFFDEEGNHIDEGMEDESMQEEVEDEIKG